jgi:putative SOS response-associated peptidase YedK
MCYYNGIKVESRIHKLRLKGLQKLIANYDFLDSPLIIGPDYPRAPMMRRVPGQADFELVMKEWGFLPPYIQSEDRITSFRDSFITLNAKVENLFINEKGDESMYAEAAMNRRCLIPSTHFFEWRHLYQRGKGGKVLKNTVAYPYLIRIPEEGIFYFAGIWNPNNIRGDNWAIVTTEANLLMSQVHNLKKRMPVILTQEMAWEWMFNDKLSTADIQSIGSHQFDSLKMKAYTVDRNLIKSPDPMKPVHYKEVPALGEDDFLITSQIELF